MAIGRFVHVDLRDLWKHEEYDFSKWLEQNIDILSQTIGMELNVVQREKAVGAFSADLLAEDSEGNLVVIENQLTATDHDHLGKVLTYLTSLEAKSAIWVTSDPRVEHVKTITWLNESTPVDTSFYLVKLAAFKIGDSDPAPLFTVVAGPSETSRAIGSERQDLANRHLLRLRFWEELLQKAKEMGVKSHLGVSPTKENWLSKGAGRSGLHYQYQVWLQGKTAVEFYIDTGDQTTNQKIFEELMAKKADIEKPFGEPLTWDRSDNRRYVAIRHVIDKGGLRDAEQWSQIQGAMVDAMDRLVKAFRPQVNHLSTWE